MHLCSYLLQYNYALSFQVHRSSNYHSMHLSKWIQCSASMQHFPQCICALLHPCIHAFEFKNESMQYLPHCIYAVQYLHQCFNGVAVPTLTRKCSLLRSELSRHNLDSCHSLQQRNPSRQNSVDDATPGTLYQGHGNDSLNKDRI